MLKAIREAIPDVKYPCFRGFSREGCIAARIIETPPQLFRRPLTEVGVPWRNFPYLRVFKRLCQALKSIVNALEKPVSKRMSAATSGNGKGC